MYIIIIIILWILIYLFRFVLWSHWFPKVPQDTIRVRLIPNTVLRRIKRQEKKKKKNSSCVCASNETAAKKMTSHIFTSLAPFGETMEAHRFLAFLPARCTPGAYSGSRCGTATKSRLVNTGKMLPMICGASSSHDSTRAARKREGDKR